MSRIKKDEVEKKITNEKPISTGGADFKELMKAFLNIRPDEKKAKNQQLKSLGRGNYESFTHVGLRLHNQFFPN